MAKNSLEQKFFAAKNSFEQKNFRQDYYFHQNFLFTKNLGAKIFSVYFLFLYKESCHPDIAQ